MKLKYHQNTFDLLSVKPQISEELIAEINDIERQYNISIPPSIKEWHSIKESKKIIETNTLGGYDFIAFQDWQKAEQFWADNFLQQDLFKELLNKGLLLLFAVYQEVSMHWVVKLDGSDDPPVFVELDSEPPDFGWQLRANHFSEFIYELVWEFIRYPKEIKLSAYTPALTPQALSALNQYFLSSSLINYREEGYRFRKDFQQIEIKIEKKCAFWRLSSTSPDSLFELASQVWELGYQLNYLSINWHWQDKNFLPKEEALELIKSAGKLAKEVSWEEYGQECFDKTDDNSFDHDVPF